MARTKLSTYRAKRDFHKTAEPSGRQAVARAAQLRFVIQKHAARRLHYDLRLELDGVFKSWAVTRGPSLDPADKRLAVEVEDHPLDYGDFEGTIPQGQYGGGTVQLWDRGYWAPLPGVDPRQALRAGQLKFALEGERLHGEWALVRMRSEGKRNNWLLIKHRDAAAGTAAQAARLLEEDRSVGSNRSLAQISAGEGKGATPFMLARGSRGARARPDAVWQSNKEPAVEAPSASGQGALRQALAQLSKVHPQKKPPRIARAAAPPDVASRAAATGARRRAAPSRAMPEFVEPQLCRLVPHPPEEAGWVHEIKFDGYRLQLRVQGGRAALRTRKGLDWSERFPELCAAARALPDCMIDAEVASLDAKGAPSFAGLQAALSSARTSELVLFAFDLLFAEGEDLRGLPLQLRKQRLQELLNGGSGPLRYVEHFEADAQTVLKSACRMQLEGIVSKLLDAPYLSGRVGTWVKSKCRAGQEVIIGGWTSDAGRLRSLLVGVHRNGKLSYAGRVGTGFGGAIARELTRRLQPLESRRCPFPPAQLPRIAWTLHWVVPKLVAEIEFAGWTEAGIVRQAAFKGLREDKPPTEIGVEEVQSTERVERSAHRATANAAASASASITTVAAKAKVTRASAPRPRTQAASRAADPPDQANPVDQADRASVLGVRISQPDKLLWPDAGDARAVSKLDLARYLESVGGWLLPHIAGRPVSLVRAPDGIDGQRFFQRHAMRGNSSLLELARVAGDREPYVVINRVEGLIAAAQIAALELHPWNCRPGRYDVPGRLVFDLDPAPDVAFAAVIQAALELRERLDALGLVSFCKTTGGKGLHVVTPLAEERRGLDWPTAKGFAQALCAAMAADSPERYLTTMAKKARVGRIFLDYLRNDRMSTAVAPLSARARPGAPVSMPLNWQQVRRGLDPARFSVRSAPALLLRNQPWGDYAQAERSLRLAIERFTKAAHRSKTAPHAEGRARRASASVA
ncbi:MAG TPA: DNA ligase D [Steroidobacteraceae bacterium]|nr:DNA ligase D [Steroidobacteraceae bacterium]